MSIEQAKNLTRSLCRAVEQAPPRLDERRRDRLNGELLSILQSLNRTTDSMSKRAFLQFEHWLRDHAPQGRALSEGFRRLETSNILSWDASRRLDDFVVFWGSVAEAESESEPESEDGSSDKDDASVKLKSSDRDRAGNGEGGSGEGSRTVVYVPNAHASRGA